MTIDRIDVIRFNRIVPIYLCLLGFVIYESFKTPVCLHAAADQTGESFKLKVDVELATIEVAALDKAGKPVRNLKPDSFRLYEDGKKQEILSFDEVSNASKSPFFVQCCLHG